MIHFLSIRISRFAFIELRANYDVLIKYHQHTDFAVMDLINVLNKLNQLKAPIYENVNTTFIATDNLNDPENYVITPQARVLAFLYSIDINDVQPGYSEEYDKFLFNKMINCN